jgi:hypothetical protein
MGTGLWLGCSLLAPFPVLGAGDDRPHTDAAWDRGLNRTGGVELRVYGAAVETCLAVQPHNARTLVNYRSLCHGRSPKLLWLGEMVVLRKGSK